jgi:flagellar export protein FliJ
MTRFLFRAQIALDLRRRQDEDARRELALAEERERAAGAALAAAQQQLEAMHARARQADASGDLAGSVWYRNWIVGHQQRLARCRQLLEQERTAVREAAAHAQRARRKLKSLERFRERAWRRHASAEARAEQKALDELGSVRFARARPRTGGHT